MTDFDPHRELWHLRRISDTSDTDALFDEVEQLDKTQLRAIVGHAAMMNPPSRRSQSPTYPDDQLSILINLWISDGYDAVRERLSQLSLAEILDVSGYAILCLGMEEGCRREARERDAP